MEFTPNHQEEATMAIQFTSSTIEVSFTDADTGRILTRYETFETDVPKAITLNAGASIAHPKYHGQRLYGPCDVALTFHADGSVDHVEL